MAAKRSGKACAARSFRRCAAPCRPPRAGPLSPATPSLTEEAHAARVRRAQEYIASGDVYQLVLASRFEGTPCAAPFEVYRALRLLESLALHVFLRAGRSITVVGSSPEALVKCHAGQAQLRPIAGSRPRGVDEAAMRRWKRSLLGGSERKRRARDAGRSGAQRFGPGRRRGSVASIPIA
jgi:anthranilate synthase component 1